MCLDSIMNFSTAKTNLSRNALNGGEGVHVTHPLTISCALLVSLTSSSTNIASTRSPTCTSFVTLENLSWIKPQVFEATHIQNKNANIEIKSLCQAARSEKEVTWQSCRPSCRSRDREVDQESQDCLAVDQESRDGLAGIIARPG